MHVVVLGPQRRPTLDAVVASLGVSGRVATVTAGWQERESDDAELHALLGGRSANLGLHGRWLDVQERDREFAVAELDHRAVVDELHQLYLVQLDAALGAVYTMVARAVTRRATASALDDAEAVVRIVDERHIERIRAVHGEFYTAWRPEEREVVAGHRAAVRDVLQGSEALVVTGGHVGVLLRVLHLFHVGPYVPPTVIAWSGGAMALTERVVLFHDRAPQGYSHAEVYDDGLGLARGVVLLPHARRRLLVDDRTRMGVLARRFAPAQCVVLDDGARVDLGDGSQLGRDARVLTPDGRITARAAA